MNINIYTDELVDTTDNLTTMTVDTGIGRGTMIDDITGTRDYTNLTSVSNGNWGTYTSRLDKNIIVSHKFRWIKREGIKILQVHESDSWVDIPFIEDPDADNYTDEINDLCNMG